MLRTIINVLACSAAGCMLVLVGGCMAAPGDGPTADHCLVLVELTAQEGKGAELLGVCERMLPDTRAFAGSKVVDLYVDQDSSDVVCWVEYWDSAEAYNTYLQWRMTDGSDPGLMPLLGGPVSIRFLNPADN